MAIRKEKLSGSTDGLGIKITQTATAGDTIHTAHATSLDEIWLWAYNDDSSDIALTLEYGGATDPDNTIVQSIPASSGLFLCIPGLILTNEKVLKAFAGTANKIVLYGYVNRIA